MEWLESRAVRPRQARYQAALRPDMRPSILAYFLGFPTGQSRTCFDHPCRTAPPFGEASCTSRPLTVAGVFPRHALSQNAFKTKTRHSAESRKPHRQTTTICREQPFSWPPTLPRWSPVTSWQWKAANRTESHVPVVREGAGTDPLERKLMVYSII